MIEQIKTLHIQDEKYPNDLKIINDAPQKLYYRGNIDLLDAKTKIAIVGCRDCTKYGERVAKDFAERLAEKGVVIVSGCARGIDSFAHKGCLNVNKETIAVLGNGLNYIYPPENKALEEQILKNNGLIISEYEPNEKPNKRNFPARNRIISAISSGVIVVEAKQKSGALITADYALDQGKEVYAVPGNIYSLNSEGTNELIKQGAKPVTCIYDVMEDFC